MIRPKYYRVDVVVRAEPPDLDTDWLSLAFERWLESEGLETTAEPLVYEVTHFG
ncbi:hypothetical protein KIV66_gp56 [Mycobacterium phage MyraDee]|uniref:Uncharacterized protein n=1 Tax=Mycobacterium phage MyraDee TaxID=2024303 RepID=A0A222YZ17_9CAUD|nr:hypothetical protein KIV66_gp56 [Mycobacterium phage MyraDee]ASR77163.1 hypothetical protein SEA_MYRADEE_56 [Mycobacterium phage MyraDee]